MPLCPRNYRLSHKPFFFSSFFCSGGYLSQAHSTNQFCFLASHQEEERKKNTFNICNTCPSSFNCGIQRLFNRLLAALSCRSKQPHKAANYSINFPTLRPSQGWRTRAGCNQRRFGGSKLTNADTHGTGLFRMCTFLASGKTTTSPKKKRKKMSGGGVFFTVQGLQTPGTPSSFSSSEHNSRSRVSECFKSRSTQHFIDFAKCAFLYTFRRGRIPRQNDSGPDMYNLTLSEASAPQAPTHTSPGCTRCVIEPSGRVQRLSGLSLVRIRIDDRDWLPTG